MSLDEKALPDILSGNVAKLEGRPFR